MAIDAVPAGKSPANVAGWAFSVTNNSIDQLLQNDSKFLVIDYSKDGTEAQRYSTGDLAALHQKGKEAISYFSIGEAEDYRYYYNPDWKTNPPSWLGKDNPDWPGNTKVQYWDPDWQKLMFNYLDKIIDSGFDGVYLDIVDCFEYWSDPNNGEGLVLDKADAAYRMIDFVGKLTEYARVQKGKPDFYVIPQNGEELLKYDKDGSFLRTISGVGVESLYFDQTSAQSSESINYRSADLNKVTAAGKPVLVIDYINDGSGYQGDNKQRIDSFWSQATTAGYTPQISSIDATILAYDPLNATLAGIVGQTAAPIVSPAPTPDPTPIAPPTPGISPVATPDPTPIAPPTPVIPPIATPDPTPIAPPTPVVPPVATPDPTPTPVVTPIAIPEPAPISPAVTPIPVVSTIPDPAETKPPIVGDDDKIIYGTLDRDCIDGGNGNDKIWGNDGNDRLLGGRGDDRLAGDQGNDKLTGGSGRDTFVYENFAPQDLGRDRITDFEVGTDKIELHLDIFSQLSPGQTLNSEEFAVVDSRRAATRSDALIVYDSSSGNLYYNANGSERGLGEGAIIANLSNHPNLSASDFTLV
jgi:cysteinyl-tRNA synthetase, unknown class